jgi:phage gp29-like protein
MATDENADAAPKTPKRKRIDTTTTVGSGSVRVFTDWTWARLRSAERMAENGDLYQAVTICEWLLTDDRIVGALDARLDALMGLEPTFEEGTGRRKKKALKALEAGEDFWEAYPESEIRQMLRWGLLLGGCLHRHEWTERADHGGRLLPMPKFWHPQTLKWNWHTRQLSVRDASSVELLVTPGDGEWVFHAPHGRNRFWAYGLWRSISRWVLFKQFALGDWSRHSEKGTQKVASSPEGTTQEDRQAVANEILNAGTDAVICIPDGFDIKLLEITADTKAIYDAQIEMANNSIAITIRGGNLTTSVDKGAGSKAATEAQAKTGDATKLKFDAVSLGTTLHDQSLAIWAEYNFGDPRLAPWPVWPVEPEEDKSQRTTMLSTLGDALDKLTKLGFDIDPKAVKEEFGLTFLGEYKKPEPIALPAPGDPASDNGKVPAGGEKPPKKDAKALGRPQLAAEDTGHIDGQLYLDDVREDAQARVGRKLKTGLIAELMEAIKSVEVPDGTDPAIAYAAIRAAVIAKYKGAASPEKIREYTRCALVMAELAGARSIHQDMED